MTVMKKALAKLTLLATAVVMPVAVTSCGQVDQATGESALSESLSSKKTKFAKVHQSWRYSKKQRAKFLADSVRGIGESTAERLIEDYNFSVQIRSWDFFKSYMRTLDNMYRYRDNPTNLYELTVKKYGSDNSKLFKRSSGGSDYDDHDGRDYSRAWGCTFDKPRSRSARANCLADAVRGIGKSTATTLINKNEFRYPPRNWTKFKEYMRILEDRHNLNDLYKNTVQRYGSTNKSKLY